MNKKTKEAIELIEGQGVILDQEYINNKTLDQLYDAMDRTIRTHLGVDLATFNFEGEIEILFRGKYRG